MKFLLRLFNVSVKIIPLLAVKFIVNVSSMAIAMTPPSRPQLSTCMCRQLMFLKMKRERPFYDEIRDYTTTVKFYCSTKLFFKISTLFGRNFEEILNGDMIVIMELKIEKFRKFAICPLNVGPHISF